MDTSVEDAKRFSEVSLHYLSVLEKELLETMFRNAYLQGRIDANQEFISGIEDVDEDDDIGTDIPWQANAAFIVQAVNNHEALLKAAKDLADRAERCQHILRERDDVRQVPPNPGWNVLDTRAIRALIESMTQKEG